MAFLLSSKHPGLLKHYANEKTYSEWREILKDIGTPKPNIDRILQRYKNKFKEE